ncbi:MAG: hypothetical protein AAFW75_27115, partial [Cyanobacteria bacterium J06636_16]
MPLAQRAACLYPRRFPQTLHLADACKVRQSIARPHLALFAILSSRISERQLRKPWQFHELPRGSNQTHRETPAICQRRALRLITSPWQFVKLPRFPKLALRNT